MGTESKAIFAGIDFMPTFANLCGFKIPTDRIIDGVDQRDLILGESIDGNRDNYLYLENKAVRQGPWKLLCANRWGKKKTRYPLEINNTVELYHLENDISESHNLASKHPEIVESLRELKIVLEEGIVSSDK